MFLTSEFIVGWEVDMYSTTEDDGSVEVCLSVRTEIVLQTPAVFNVATSSGEAEGNSLVLTEL